MAHEICVHAYEWTIKDAASDEGHVVIHCWALDRDSKPYLLRIEDFPMFCYIELPRFVRNRSDKWSKSNIDTIMGQICKVLGQDSPIRYSYRELKKLYYYRCDQLYPMIMVSFSTIKAMKHCVNFLSNPIKTEDFGYLSCHVL